MKKLVLKAAVLMAAMLCAPLAANASLLIFNAALDAAQVVDGGPSHSSATGLATVTLDTDFFTLTTDYSWQGLTGRGTRAHLHSAPAGQTREPPNGGFFHGVFSADAVDDEYLIDCTAIGQYYCVTTSGKTHDVLQLSVDNGYGHFYTDLTNFEEVAPWTFQDLVDAFENGDMYIDMHTEEYPGDEIRGQFAAAVPEPETYALMLAGLGLVGAAVRRRTAK
jgi:hypothetical protein